MFKVAIIYKFSIVFLLFLALCFLGFSGFKFINSDYELAIWHRFFGFSIPVVVILHIITNYKKLVKLLNEVVDVIANRANPTYCNMDRLIDTFKPYRLRSRYSI